MGAASTQALAQSVPVGNWRFEEGSGTTTADSSPSGNSGTLVNGPSWTTGKIGGALAFNGGNQSVAITDTGNLDNLYTTGLTVMAWVYVPASNSSGRIIDKDNNNQGWFFELVNSSVQFQSDQLQSSGAVEPSRTSAATIPTGTWTHVAATWDGGVSGANIHIYINGALSDGTEVEGSGTPASDAGVPFTIGNRPVDNARGFSGTLDEVRVYNRVLSASEIQAIYTGAGGGDTQPPTAPANLAAQATSASQINLTWSASTDNVGVTSYLIERCEGSGCTSFSQIGSTSGTSYGDSGLAASTTYTYRVRATDAAGNLSNYSNTSSATTSSSDAQPPSAPGTPQVVASSSSEVDLIWSASTDNVSVAGYLLERCSGASCSNFVQIASPTVAGYNDVGLTGATSYTYRVRAKDSSGNLSDYSSVLTLTTPASSPDCN